MIDADPEPPPWRWIDTSVALERLGAQIAERLAVGDAICLWGPLGAGKSTLARGLIRRLTTPDEDVPSPTFTLVQVYLAQDLSLQGLSIAHFDLYRLKTAEEAFELGIDEALAEGATVIEWPERMGYDLPPHRLDVELRFAANGSTDGREIRLTGRGSWAERARDIERQRDVCQGDV